MPKIRINEMDGKPATSSVTLDGNRRLFAGETADVEDLEPYRGLIDRNILVTVAGRPKAKGMIDAAAADPD